MVYFFAIATVLIALGAAKEIEMVPEKGGVRETTQEVFSYKGVYDVDPKQLALKKEVEHQFGSVNGRFSILGDLRGEPIPEMSKQKVGLVLDLDTPVDYYGIMLEGLTRKNDPVLLPPGVLPPGGRNDEDIRNANNIRIGTGNVIGEEVVIEEGVIEEGVTEEVRNGNGNDGPREVIPSPAEEETDDNPPAITITFLRNNKVIKSFSSYEIVEMLDSTYLTKDPIKWLHEAAYAPPDGIPDMPPPDMLPPDMPPGTTSQLMALLASDMPKGTTSQLMALLTNMHIPEHAVNRDLPDSAEHPALPELFSGFINFACYDPECYYDTVIVQLEPTQPIRFGNITVGMITNPTDPPTTKPSTTETKSTVPPQAQPASGMSGGSIAGTIVGTATAAVGSLSAAKYGYDAFRLVSEVATPAATTFTSAHVPDATVDGVQREERVNAEDLYV